MRGIDLVFRGQVGEAIRLARERAGLSAVRLAEATGIHRVALGNIEKGECEVTLVELVVLARALGATPVQLVYPGVPDRLVEVLPGVEAKAIDAVMWFSGERRRKPWSVEHPDGTEERALDLARKREQLNSGQPGGGWSVLAANLDKARDWTAWAFAEAAWWKQGADLVAALTALGEGSKALADSELKRLRDELDDAVDAREHAIGLRNAAIRERDELRAELAITKPVWPIDPLSPADLRRAADNPIRDALAAIVRVRELHQPVYQGEIGQMVCAGCSGEVPETWPCPTIRALDGDGDE